MKHARGLVLLEMFLVSTLSPATGGRTARTRGPLTRNMRADSVFWWHTMEKTYVGPDSEPTNNDHGEFAWYIAHRLDATGRYLAVVAGDSAAWRLLRRDVAAALSARDSRLGLRDYAGRSRPVWSTIDPYAEPKGTRSALLCDNAQVAAGLARAAIALRRGKPGDRALADSALAAALAALAAFEADEHDDSRTNGVYYRFPPDSPIRASEQGQIVPMNYLSATGRAYLWLARATGNETFRARAEALARFVLSRARLVDSALFWKYQEGSAIEDIGHGGITASFLMMLSPEPRVDGVGVREALSGTLRKLFILKGDSLVINDHVDGSKDGNPRYLGAFGQWAEAVPTACDLYEDLTRALWSYRGKLQGGGIVGATALLEAEAVCPGAAAILGRVEGNAG